MTVQLSTKPGSSTPAQRSRLVVFGKRKGFDLDEIRSMVGGSVKALSADAASGWIEHFGGGPLPNPPGEKPPAYRGKPAPGVVRMITDDQVDQIGRLGSDYFGSAKSFYAWLGKDFKVDVIRQLGTAERAGQVIRVLKTMLARKAAKPSRAREEAV